MKTQGACEWEKCAGHERNRCGGENLGNREMRP